MPASGTRSGPPSQSQPSSKAPLAQVDDDYIRLHITPLDADLFPVVLPASLQPRARNVSFHTVQTFPENRYGFVDLPKADADKLRAKLNGSVLKGTKMRIETARPEVREEPSGEGPMTTKTKKDKSSKKAKSKAKEDGSASASASSGKKRKRGDEVQEGVLLTDRKVKRGWTETPDHKSKNKDKKRSSKDAKVEKGDKAKRVKSKYTEQEECLLKIRLPPGATLPSGGGSDDAAAARKKRKKQGKEREITVHEFENTTRFPGFLKGAGGSSSRADAAEFVEGKGWVDEDGNVVEPVESRHRPSPNLERKSKTVTRSAAVPMDVDSSGDDTSSSNASSSDVDEEEREEAQLAQKKKAAPVDDDDDDETTSSSGSSSSEGEEKEEAEEEPESGTVNPPVAPETPPSAPKTRRARPESSSSSSRNLTIKIPPQNTPPSAKVVHPLEALYKRKKPEDAGAETPTQQNQEPFTFFGADDVEDGDGNGGGDGGDSNPPIPMTPFSRQDFEWRNVRSAAPTPDTAHPSRMQLWPMRDDEDEDEDDDDEHETEDMDGVVHQGEGVDQDEDGDDEGPNQTKATGMGDGKGQASSDFQSWFWENRRELNQSWMKRRKTAAKEKRHRENKARASKAV